MPILEYLLPCLLTSIDQRTNAVSLFSIVETLTVVRRPGETGKEALPGTEVVTLWRRLPYDSHDQTFTQILTLCPPDGNESEVSRVEFQIPHFRHRLHVELPPFGVDQEGDYLLRAYLGSTRPADATKPEREYPIRVLRSDLPIVIQLLPKELTWLRRPISGQGGFQSLLRRIQNQISDEKLVLNESDAERLIRYASQYGGGGFQARLGRIVDQVRAVLGG
jgi:hypothetical protein